MSSSPQEPTPVRPEPPPGAQKPATWPQAIRAVGWSFFGIRKRGAMQRDVVAIRPHQVIIVGLVGAALFVLTLILVVRAVVA